VSVDVAVPDLDAAMDELHRGLEVDWTPVGDVPGGGRETWQLDGVPVVHLMERPGIDAPHVVHVTCPTSDVAGAAGEFEALGWKRAADEGSDAEPVFAGPFSGMHVRLVDEQAHAALVDRLGLPDTEPVASRRGLVQVCAVVPQLEEAVEELRAAGVELSETSVFELDGATMNTVHGRRFPYLELIRSNPESDWVAETPQIDHVCWLVADWDKSLSRLIDSGIPIEVDQRHYAMPYTFHRAPASGLRLEMFEEELGRSVPTFFVFEDAAP
jgi:catechol 2,3-dioxygenase-like lactoylglutathione lyase family enzyme